MSLPKLSESHLVSPWLLTTCDDSWGPRAVSKQQHSDDDASCHTSFKIVMLKSHNGNWLFCFLTRMTNDLLWFCDKPPIVVLWQITYSGYCGSSWLKRISSSQIIYLLPVHLSCHTWRWKGFRPKSDQSWANITDAGPVLNWHLDYT